VLSGRSSTKFILLAACFLLVACLGYTSTLNTETAHSPTSLRHIPEDGTPYRHFVFRYYNRKRQEISMLPLPLLIQMSYNASIPPKLNCRNVFVSMPTREFNPSTLDFATSFWTLCFSQLWRIILFIKVKVKLSL
jgi:hypothetical protein